MVLRFEDNQGLQALDNNQIIEVFSGNSVSSGVDTTVNSGTLGQSDTLQVASGDVIVGSSKISVSQQNVQIDSSDPDNPRKDVVYIDSNGNVQVDKGTPEDPEPEGANRFNLFQPAPPERDNVDGAVVAEVFVGAGVSSISSNDVRDRRLISNLAVDQLTFFDSLDFGDDQNLNFGDAPDFSIRYDSTDDELKVKDEVNDTEKQAWDKSGDTFFRNGAVQVGKDIKTTGNQTIWDSSATEIPDSAMGSINNATLTNSSITVNAGDGLTNGGLVSLGGSVAVDVATNGIGTDEIDESISPTWTGLHTFSSGIDLNSNKITNVASPTNPDDAATKSYADALEQGLDIKDSVRVASQSNIDLTSSTDPNPVDGVNISDGDRLLLKSQTDSTENGIYVASTATDPTTWVRSADADEDSEVTSGMFMFVGEGTESGNESYILVTDDPITLGTTSLSFTVFSRAGEITAGSGLAKSGNTLSVNTANGLEVVSDNVQIQTDAIGSNELDTSVGYSFSSQIDFTGGFGGGGNAVVFNDNIDANEGMRILNAPLETAFINATTDTSGTNKNFVDLAVFTGSQQDDIKWQRSASNQQAFKVRNITTGNDLIRIFDSGLVELDAGGINLNTSGSIQDSGTDAIQFDGSANVTIPSVLTVENQIGVVSSSAEQLSLQTPTGDTSEIQFTYSHDGGTKDFSLIATPSQFKIFNFQTNNDRFAINDQGDIDILNGNLDLNNNNINNVASIDGGGNAINVNDALNMANSDSIQDAGTDAISFDGSANPQFPNKIGGDGGAITSQNTILSEGRLRSNDIMQPRGGARTSFVSGDADPAIFGAATGFAGSGEFGTLVLQSRSNSKKPIVLANYDGSSVKETLVATGNNNVEILNGDLSITQDGTSGDPAISLGGSGAGFFINSSGEVVVVDEAGNTTTIS